MVKPAGLPSLRLFAVICVLAVTAVGALLYPRLAASPDAAVEPMPALLATTPIRPGEPLLPLPDSLPVDPAKVALGRLLFNDPRLSRDDSLACAGCHDLQRGGADGLPVSRGVDGKKGGINAPTVLNAAFNFRQFWDGRAATLEEQVEGPVHNPLEMAADWDQVLVKLQADKDLRSRFASAYPAGLTAATVRHAIAEMLTRGDIHDPVIEGHLITVPEVRMSPDLRLATVYVMPLAGRDAAEVVAALERNKKFMRGEVAHAVNLKFAPDLRFHIDDRFAEAERIDKLLRSPQVARDLEKDDE